MCYDTFVTVMLRHNDEIMCCDTFVTAMLRHNDEITRKLNVLLFIHKLTVFESPSKEAFITDSKICHHTKKFGRDSPSNIEFGLLI